MNFWLNIRLKVRNFIKKYRIIIILAVIIFTIIFSVNYAFKKKKDIEIFNENANVTEPSQVIDTTDEVPSQYKEPINNLIDSYINYCNNKEYESAYNLLEDDFKNEYFKGIDKFKKYVDTIFKKKRMYNIQNYSNYNNVYVYKVSIIDDLLSTGSTGGYNSVEDKFVITQRDGSLKLALNGYCGSKELNIQSEDKYMKINIIKKNMKYDTVTYIVQFENKTDNYIVLGDGTENNEIVLKVENGAKVCDMTDTNVVIAANSTSTQKITFNKYFDDGKEDESLILNAIRILPEYSGKEENATKEKKKAIKLYSLTIDLKQDKQ